MMAATVSSSGRNKVGPKQTARFDILIMFRLDSAATLQRHKVKVTKYSDKSTEITGTVGLYYNETKHNRLYTTSVSVRH